MRTSRHGNLQAPDWKMNAVGRSTLIRMMMMVKMMMMTVMYHILMILLFKYEIIRMVSHNYGYGLMDAEAMVKLAR